MLLCRPSRPPCPSVADGEWPATETARKPACQATRLASKPSPADAGLAVRGRAVPWAPRDRALADRAHRAATAPTAVLIPTAPGACRALPSEQPPGRRCRQAPDNPHPGRLIVAWPVPLGVILTVVARMAAGRARQATGLGRRR